ncbi:hypothetical protein Zm00014a_005739 [Zea mays]|uniref:Uncharacterized protein n=1 Tax=Zea mays TaxID=4577 RepID=A0A3L6G184_MAIZE|nr:hypothetical protein Zm00014a_005739 [Zea mays]
MISNLTKSTQRSTDL